MAMMDFEEQKQIIAIANEFDVCVTCANDLAKEKGITLNSAKSSLEGNIKGEMAIKISELTTTVICKSCIKKFYEQLFPQTEEVTSEPKKEKETNAKEDKNEAKSTKTKK